jgi:two-component sensor histidine kinase
MVPHALATNAAKHGAFSKPGGRLWLQWRWLGNGLSGRLIIDWRQFGGLTIRSQVNLVSPPTEVHDVPAHAVEGIARG